MQRCDLRLAAGTAHQHGIAWKVADVLVLTHEQWSQQVAWQHVMHTRQTRSNGGIFSRTSQWDLAFDQLHAQQVHTSSQSAAVEASP